MSPVPSDAPRLLVILPTFNERENLERQVSAVLAQQDSAEVLIVDDNSPDGTGRLAEQMASAERRVHALHRARKLGLGTAYVAGFRWALQRGFEAVMEMDADGSHDPAAIPHFLDALEELDLVLGSRYLEGVRVLDWSFRRLALSYLANRYAGWVTGLPFTDTTGGFKCYRRAVLEGIELDAIRSEGYAFQIETTFRAWRKGFRVGEIPIVFYERRDGASKMSGRIVREAVWRVWALRLLQLSGRL